MGLQTLEAYTMDFETPLLAGTREYFVRKTADWIQNDPTPVYLEKVS